MTYEEKLELIKSYIEDIKSYEQNPDLSVDGKQHVKRALHAYTELYREVEKGKIDPDFLHENITSFLYYIQ